MHQSSGQNKEGAVSLCIPLARNTLPLMSVEGVRTQYKGQKRFKYNPAVKQFRFKVFFLTVELYLYLFCALY